MTIGLDGTAQSLNSFLEFYPIKMYWLFAPGTSSHLLQLSKYCETVAYDGKPIICKKCLPIIGENWVCVKFPDIQTDLVDETPLARGIAKAICTVKRWNDDIEPTDYAYRVRLTKYNLGQEADVAAVETAFEKIPLGEDYICFGVSRGCAALVGWLAAAPPGRRPPRSVVLEGCPASLPSITRNSTGLGWLYYSVVEAVLPKISSWDPSGSSALSLITKISPEIPILLVTSKADRVVPMGCSLDLFQVLKNAGHRKTELLVLEHAGHTDYTHNNREDRDRYFQRLIQFLFDDCQQK